MAEVTIGAVAIRPDPMDLTSLVAPFQPLSRESGLKSAGRSLAQVATNHRSGVGRAIRLPLEASLVALPRGQEQET